MDQIVWWLVQRARYRTGASGSRAEVGVFTSPEEAFRAMRCHPDFQEAELVWHPEPWEGEAAYRAPARTRLRGEWEHCELLLFPVRLNEPVFDYLDDRAEYERLRAALRE